MGRSGKAVGLLVLGLLAGCHREPERPPDTGARDAARTFYEALVRQDWAAAHEALHPDSRSHFPLPHFSALAENYRRGLGFEPHEVRVRACEEQGDEAIAHLVLAGRSGAKSRSFRDAVKVRRSGAAWLVVLPPRFGEVRR
jgi:hypothetical protein